MDVIFDSACYPGSLTAVLEMGIPANGATIVPMGFCTAQEGITQAMINTRELSIIGTRMSCNQFQPTIEISPSARWDRSLRTSFIPPRI